MIFDEVQFPITLAYGSSGGPEFHTDILVVNSGREERICKWSQPRRKYNASYALRSYADLLVVRDFYIARSGALNGFRFKDWSDYTGTNQHIGNGNGSETAFQLLKHYISGPVSRARQIQKPVSGSVAIAFDGVDQPSGWTVSTITGVVSFSSAPAQGVAITASYEFDVPVRFEETGILGISHDDFGSGSIPSIIMVEILEDLIDFEDPHYGGGFHKDVLQARDTNVSITPLNGLAIYIEHDNNGQIVKLPDLKKIPPGGPIMVLRHNSVYDLVDNDDNVVLSTVPDNNHFQILVGVNALGEKVWMTFGEEVIVV